MKIGDKVRFLNSVGGGIVCRFQGKDLVIIEEEDGFETPVLIRECVVVDDASNKVSKPAYQETKAENIKPVVNNETAQPVKITEVSGGDKLNVALAFLPVDIKNLGKTDFETFFINDSNYFLFFNYMSRQNNSWISRHTELIEPNTQIFIEEFSKSQLSELEKLCIQLVAFKKDKPYSLKNSYSVELRIDALKFFKLHSFRENDFFEDEALIYPIVTNDVPAKELLISAAELKEAMTQKLAVDKPRKIIPQAKKDKKPAIIEIDLHINQLLDTTAGLSNTDMLQYQLSKFRETIEENKNKKGQKIVFIHGKGEGVLRTAILNELKTKYKNYPTQDASFKEYGFGATMVTIK
ncbi:hypothetical protein M2138_000563 [Dysgonomonadaceae bacterium PH5-43]|nr:hypothetical protein [Dysgonomonadaceae bacterium PH5-43]